MATSGTYAFSPETVDLVTEALERCGRTATEINSAMLDSARRSMSMLLAEWSNSGPNQWQIDQQSQALAASTTNYALATGTLAILTAFVRDTNTNDDRVLGRIGRAEYAGYTSKDSTTSSGPNVFWEDRGAATKTIYIYPAPSTTGYTLYYDRIRIGQDVTGVYSQTADIPWNWTDAMAAGLAARLAVKWAPDRYDSLQMQADKAYLLARGEDRERVPLTIRPTWGRR